VENERTLAEINKTVQENIKPMGSRIRWKVTGVAIIDDICHSNRVVDEYQIADSVLGSSISRIDHIINLAVDEMERLYFIIN
jgi:hypothetical protein